MARKLSPSTIALPSDGDRVRLGEKVIGVTIANQSTSDGNLHIGVNSDDTVVVLAPGQEFSIGGYATNEPYYLDDSYFKFEWASGATIKEAYYVLVKDSGENC